MTEILDVTIILARIRRCLSRDFVACILSNDCSLTSGFGDSDSSFRVVLSGSRI
jgi:hypothetical protein